MLSRISRFASLAAIACIAVVSVACSGIARVVSAVSAGLGFAFDLSVRAMLKAANAMPSLAPSVHDPEPAERTRLKAADTYARTQEVRRRPNVQPNFRLCGSV